MPDQDFTPGLYAATLQRAREAQAKKVMPLIGPLLDAWDMMPNDVNTELRESCPSLCDHLDKIAAAMETDLAD